MARRDNRDLDKEAIAAGFPGGRKEREAFRRATKAAAAKGAPTPKPPTERAKYKPLPAGAPGGRGRKAVTPPKDRTRNQWHELGSGGRVKTTGRMDNVFNSLASAQKNGEQIFLTVKGSVTKSYETKPSDAGEATLRGWSPDTILAAIQAEAGARVTPPFAIDVKSADVRAALSSLLEGLPEYDRVDDITSVTIRAY